ncbi:hypothetical protein ACOME3_002013 [Neoechinorhynchus agilis]
MPDNLLTLVRTISDSRLNIDYTKHKNRMDRKHSQSENEWSEKISQQIRFVDLRMSCSCERDYDASEESSSDLCDVGSPFRSTGNRTFVKNSILKNKQSSSDIDSDNANYQKEFPIKLGRSQQMMKKYVHSKPSEIGRNKFRPADVTVDCHLNSECSIKEKADAMYTTEYNRCRRALSDLISDWRKTEAMVSPSCQTAYRRLNDLACRLERLTTGTDIMKCSNCHQVDVHIKQLEAIEVDLSDCEKSLSRVDHSVRRDRDEWSLIETRMVENIVDSMQQSIHLEAERLRRFHSQLTHLLMLWETFEQTFYSVNRILLQCETDLSNLENHSDLDQLRNRSTFDRVLQAKLDDLSRVHGRITHLKFLLSQIETGCTRSRFDVLKRRVQGLTESFDTMISWCHDIRNNQLYTTSSAQRLISGLDDIQVSTEFSRRVGDPVLLNCSTWITYNRLSDADMTDSPSLEDENAAGDRSVHLTADSGYHEDSRVSLGPSDLNEFSREMHTVDDDCGLNNIQSTSNSYCTSTESDNNINQKDCSGYKDRTINTSTVKSSSSRCYKWTLFLLLSILLLTIVFCILANVLDCCSYSDTNIGEPLCRSRDCSLYT